MVKLLKDALMGQLELSMFVMSVIIVWAVYSVLQNSTSTTVTIKRGVEVVALFHTSRPEPPHRAAVYCSPVLSPLSAVALAVST